MGFFSWLCDRCHVLNLVEEARHLVQILNNGNLPADEKLSYVRRFNRVLDRLAFYMGKHPVAMSEIRLGWLYGYYEKHAKQVNVELGRSVPSGWGDCFQGTAVGVVLPGSGAITGIRVIVNGYMFGVEGELAEIVAELADSPFGEKQNIPNGRTFVAVYLVEDRESFSQAGFAAKEITEISFDDYKNL